MRNNLKPSPIGTVVCGSVTYNILPLPKNKHGYYNPLSLDAMMVEWEAEDSTELLAELRVTEITVSLQPQFDHVTILFKSFLTACFTALIVWEDGTRGPFTVGIEPDEPTWAQFAFLVRA